MIPDPKATQRRRNEAERQAAEQEDVVEQARTEVADAGRDLAEAEDQAPREREEGP
jgi:hypothetical protein